MKLVFTLSSFLIILFLSCQTPQEKAAKAYQEAVALTTQAEEAKAKGDLASATNLSKQSTEKLQEAIKLDSATDGTRAAIAHNYFVAGQHQEALQWYEKANATEGEKANNYMEMGLSKLTLGELNEGHTLLDKAIALDPSKEMIGRINKGMVPIGEKSFEDGQAAKNKGDLEAGKKQQNFAMSVLMLAYYYDNSRKDVAEKVAKFADEIGDHTIHMQYTKLSQK